MCISLPPCCLYSHYTTELLLLEVLTEMAMKRTIFWDVIPYHLREVHFAGYFRGLLFNLECSSGASVNFFLTTCCYIPEDPICHLHYFAVCCVLSAA